MGKNMEMAGRWKELVLAGQTRENGASDSESLRNIGIGHRLNEMDLWFRLQDGMNV